MTDKLDLPIIDYTDMHNNPKRFIDGVVNAIEGSPGFLQIANPPVDTDLWNRAQQLIYELLARPVSELVPYMLPERLFQRGASPFGGETARGSLAPDMKTNWTIREPTMPDDTQDCPFGPNIWPSWMPELQGVMLQVMTGQMRLFYDLLLCVEEYYGLGQGYLARRAHGAESVMRPILYEHPNVYLAQARDLLKDHRDVLSPQLIEIYEHVLSQGHLDDSVPSAAHLDINLLTILLSAAGSSGGGGLELLMGDQWVPAGTQKGIALINIGEMLPKVHTKLAHLRGTRHRVTRFDHDGRNWPTGWWRAIAPFFGYMLHSTIMANGEPYRVAFMRRIRQLVGEETEEAEAP